MTKRIITMILMGFIVFGGSAIAQKKKKKASSEEAPKKEEKKEESVDDKVKKSKKVDGLFTVYQDTVSGSVQLFIKKDQMNKEFIYQSFSMGGPADLFLNQNMLRDTWLFSIRKTFDKIEFVRSNTNFYYDPENPVSKSANVDVADAVFYSVKAEASDDTGYLIQADNLFLSQKLDQVKPTLPPGIPPTAVLNLGSLKKDKSNYSMLRSYPNNTDFVVNLAYENPSPLNSGGASVTDARYVNVKMQHSFLEVPDNNFNPRYDDPRVGYFTQEVKDMTSYSATPYKDVINRWNLVKKDPSAAVSEPLEPIVWWVENTTPKEWRETILEAGNKWNIAFEAAGFKNAVVMKMMPDDAEWDPADIRYNVIRWVSSDLGYAIGPSFVNPRTGQILGADITIDFGIMSRASQESEIFDAYTADLNFTAKHAQCSIGKGLKMQYGMASTVVEAFSDAAGDIDKLKHQFMTFLVLHEMGHTMGLNHNMKASNMLSPAQLADQSVTREKGVTGSVMDYPSANLIMQDNPVDYYTTTVGPYDKWAIEFGYRTFSSSNEAAGLNKILTRSHEPDLIFGNDADIISPFGGVDPRVRTWDLSGDMVSYAEGQFKLVNTTMGKLKDKFVKDGESYQNLRGNYNGLRGQRMAMTQGLVGYIGGIYVDRSFPEQNSGNNPYTPVPESYQKKTMNLLSKYIFAPDAFSADAQLYSFLQLQRRGFNFGGTTEDPNLQAYSSSMYNMVYSFLLSSNTLSRINNTSLYGNTYSVSEMVNDLVSSVFDADINKNVNLHRQNAQTDLVKSLAGVVNAKSGYDNASKAACFSALNTLQARLKRTASIGDAQTKSHRSYLVHMIDKAMETE